MIARRTATMVAIGALLIGLGIYLFPFGQDAFFYFLIDLGGGDYWTGMFYAYIICTAMIVGGIFLARPQYIYSFIRIIRRPTNFLVFMILVAMVAYVALMGGR
ncbi:MAG: hypothetical protein PHZ19_10410 [Candidatus Thermoplasmatota archaeon]|nr:hypothetical protein [Candidatus Thermoplasmatota archaeon]